MIFRISCFEKCYFIDFIDNQSSEKNVKIWDKLSVVECSLQ